MFVPLLDLLFIVKSKCDSETKKNDPTANTANEKNATFSIALYATIVRVIIRQTFFAKKCKYSASFLIFQFFFANSKKIHSEIATKMPS